MFTWASSFHTYTGLRATNFLPTLYFSTLRLVWRSVVVRTRKREPSVHSRTTRDGDKLLTSYSPRWKNIRLFQNSTNGNCKLKIGGFERTPDLFITLQNGYDFYREIQTLLENSKVDYGALSTYAQQCYDATWSLALSLNNTINSEFTELCV